MSNQTTASRVAVLWRSGDRFRNLARIVRRGQRQWRSSLLLALGLATALILRFPAAAVAQTAPIASANSAEIRGVWLTNVDSDVLFSRDNLRQAIRRLDRLNFNTLYPTVWNGGYTLYPSDVAKQAMGVAVDPDPAFEKRDMLAEAIQIGHNRDMAVIPWFEFGLMAPAESELVQAHPDWVSRRKNGNAIFNMHGQDRSVWLTPAHPEVQKFLVDLITEVVTQYDVDGIQLDDHFGMPAEVGYDPYTIDLYKQEHQGRTPPSNAQDPEWIRWRASKVSDLMVQLYSAVKTHKPDCLISLAPNPKDHAYQQSLQDWYSWQRLGFIDELIVQVYRSDLRHFIGELDRPELRAVRSKIPVGIGILTGLSVRNVDMNNIARQVRVSRDRQFAGVSFFFYGSLGNRDASFQALFPDPATRPRFSTTSASNVSS